MTRLVAELSAPYQAEIPYKIILLDYYGRQLELGLAASNPATLKRATADLRDPAILDVNVAAITRDAGAVDNGAAFNLDIDIRHFLFPPQSVGTV